MRRSVIAPHAGLKLLGLLAFMEVLVQASAEHSASPPIVETSCTVNLTVSKDRNEFFDLTLLQKWSPWRYSFSLKESKPLQSLEFNFCGGSSSGASEDPCQNSSICSIEDGKRTSFSTQSRSLEDHMLFASGLNLEFTGPSCGPYQTRLIINLFCGPHLSYPRLIWSSDCTKVFDWATSAACLKPPKREEVPCSVYDSDGQLFDLSPLIKSQGGHRVETINDKEEFVINVCSNIIPDGKSLECPAGSASCYNDGKQIYGVGRVLSRLSLVVGNLQLVYEEPKAGNRIPGCSSPAKTVINFRCPKQKAAQPPRLLSSRDCYYEVEWETDHACPLYLLKGNFSSCSFDRSRNGVDIDLSPLRKAKNEAPYSIVVDLFHNNSRFEFLLNVCGGIPSMHECNPGWKSTAVCLRQEHTSKGSMLCQTTNSQLKYADGEVTLTYQGTKSCPKSNQGSTGVVIKFLCDEDAESNGMGNGKFLYEDECTFFFEWPTKHACPKLSENVCIFSHGSTQFNLAAVSAATGQYIWNVVDSLSGSGDSKEMYLNLCGAPDLLKEKCPGEALVCLFANQTYSNMGSVMSDPVYDELTNRVDIQFKSGEFCSGGKRKQTKLSISCAPGQITNSPILLHLSDCYAELEWSSAAACPLMITTGSDCRVYDQNLGLVIDLGALKSSSSHQMEALGYVYHINVCSPVKVKGCQDKAGGCQKELGKGTEHRIFNLGVASSNLTYRDGFISLVYTNGDPYRDPARTPRSMTIAFLCDPDAGVGQPVFEGEADRAYSFRWDTSYACPKEVSVDCMVLDLETHRQYDLSSLTKSSGNWEVMVADGKRKIYLNVCRPINRVDSCKHHSAACAVSIKNGQSVAAVNLGQSLTQPKISSDGHLLLRYSLGDFCVNYGEKTNYSVTINFICQKGSSTKGPLFLGMLGSCQFSFLWATQAACPIGDETEKDCRFKDPISGTTYDLGPLIKNNSYYEINTNNRKFRLNICNAVGKGGCPQAWRENVSQSVAACELNPDGKSIKTTLGSADSHMLHSSVNGPIRLMYIGEYNGTVTRSDTDNRAFFTHTDIRFLCQKDVNDVRFLKQENETYFFEFGTPLVCAPNPVDCDVTDESGLDYDLNSLVNNGSSDWIAEPSSGSTFEKFHLSFCKPLTGLGGLACHGAGICRISSSNPSSRFLSLGTQQPPRVVSNGILQIEYKDGSPCHGTKSLLSAQVTLHCSTVQGYPRLLGISPECNYVFNLHTPAACPIKTFKGDNCQVTDKVYGYTFDLSPLRNANSDYRVKVGEYTYLINVCGALKSAPMGCQESAICQTKEHDKSFVVSAGKPSEELTLRDGLIQLVYSGGKSNCHKVYNRTTFLSFICDQSTDGFESGPRFISEEEDCTYVFQWATRYACPPHKTVHCSAQDTKGLTYDLSGLSLPGGNYVVQHPAQSKTKFILNVCRSLVYQEDQLCPYSSTACLIIGRNPNPTNKAVSIGETLNMPTFADGKLLLRYSNGSPCPTDKNTHFQTLVEFQCDPTGNKGEPEFVSMDACVYNFLWLTKYACPLPEVVTTSGHCTAVNPTTGYVFNLTSLTLDKGYHVQTQNQEDFLLNVCSDVKSSQCNPGVGTCLTKDGSPKVSLSVGQANGDLQYSHGTLYLNYSQGEKCANGLEQRSTFITFECSRVNKSPVFLSHMNDCTYFFNWDTPLACEGGVGEETLDGSHDQINGQIQIPCVVRTPNGTLDLSSLMHKDNAYQALNVNRYTGIYGIKICKSLGGFHELGLGDPAAVCSLCFGGTKPLSLGTLEKPPYVDSLKRIVIDYVNGSTCTYNASKKFSSKIIFICDPSNEDTLNIIDVDEERCTAIFELRTPVVCEGPQVQNLCTFSEHQSGFHLDLSKLGNAGQPFVVKGGSSSYMLGICQVVKKEGPCRGAGVCRVSQDKTREENLGLVGKTSFFHNGVHLTMIYHTDQDCSEEEFGKVQTEIKFYCHPSIGIGKPQLYKSSNCVTVFMWLTSAVCHLDHPPCTLFASNRLFDLRELASISHSWSVTTQDFMYWLNVCKEVHPGIVNDTHSVSCSPYASVCQVAPDRTTKMLGNFLTQKLSYNEKAKELVLMYDYGDDTVCPQKDPDSEAPKASAEIVFTCDTRVGHPEFVSGPDERCRYRFAWKSSIACPGLNVSRISEEKGLLVDKRLEEGKYFLNISGIFNRLFQVKEQHRDADNFVYTINLNQGVGESIDDSECAFAAVCQSKSDGSFHRDIGSVGTRKFYLRGSELRLILTSHGRKCGKNTSKNVSSIIHFQCATEGGLGVPEFLYENNNCDYFFQWDTNAVCPQSPKRKGFFGGLHVPSQSQSVSPSTESSLSTLSIVGIILLLLTAIMLVVVLARRERRTYLKTKVKGCFQSFRLPCYTYRDFQCYFLKGRESSNSQSDGEAVLLAPHETFPKFQDESDSDPIA